ncbi:hypothetical protein ABZ793_20770 [Micromonospora sp. NPDC047465]|uniref:hypothetical protein n=1 Tax=Micromonospora sp. NPDC047465 TaxID=3154813 RepID=UPI0034047E01
MACLAELVGAAPTAVSRRLAKLRLASWCAAGARDLRQLLRCRPARAATAG